MQGTPGPAGVAETPRRLTIELLALDLATCGRCTRTSANLDDAVGAVAGVLREAGIEVEVRRTVVTSAAQAERLRFESSPTIRVNGRDIALELRETRCADCGELCGCAGGVDCRVWVWQGREHQEAPRAMIVDALLRGYGGDWERAPGRPRPFRLPENLQRYFAARETAAPTTAGACCDVTRCCAASGRQACCGEPAAASAGGSGG